MKNPSAWHRLGRLLLATVMMFGCSLATLTPVSAAMILSTCPHYEADGSLVSEQVYEANWMTVWGLNGAQNEADALCVGYMTFERNATATIALTDPVGLQTVTSALLYAQWSRFPTLNDLSGYRVRIVNETAVLADWVTPAPLSDTATPGGVIVQIEMPLTFVGRQASSWGDARFQIEGIVERVGKPDRFLFGLFRHDVTIA